MAKPASSLAEGIATPNRRPAIWTKMIRKIKTTNNPAMKLEKRYNPSSNLRIRTPPPISKVCRFYP